MKETAIILLLLLITTDFSYSQEEQGLFHSAFEQTSFTVLEPDKILFSSDPKIDFIKYTEYSGEISTILKKLSEKQGKWSQETLIEKIFYTLHRKKLKWYENYVSFGDIFSSGKYDCVTGTAFFASVMEKLEIPCTIYEFDFHALLVAGTGEGQVLLESTDPFNGVVKDPAEISRRIAIYAAGGDPASDPTTPVGSSTNTSSTHIHNQISLLELAGLQYFNLAARAFNDGDLALAKTFIEKAHLIYPSRRISELRKILSSQNLVTIR